MFEIQIEIMGVLETISKREAQNKKTPIDERWLEQPQKDSKRLLFLLGSPWRYKLKEI